MSNHYQIIAKARDIANVLAEYPDWTKTAIIKEMGVDFYLYEDIMKLDPVVVGDKIRTKTIEKLKAFIEKHLCILDKEPVPRGVRTSKSVDPFDPPVPIPRKEEPKKPDPPKGDDPLTRLDDLIAEFASRGYKLETRIIKIAP